MNSKKTIENQKYEDYWKLTLEYSDFKGKKFNKCLNIIVNFIDKHKNEEIIEDTYKSLQENVYKFNPKKDCGSVRKSINQFFKLGFINNNFKGYHKKTKQFLAENNPIKKRIIYSEILYDNASFSRSATKSSNEKELNFLVKTIEHCGSINKEDLIAIMFEKISDYKHGYISPNELKEITKKAKENDLIKRKYNQLNYLWDICKNVLVGIYFDAKTNTITLEKPELSESETRNHKEGRDSYKQTLYKNWLYEESRGINNEVLCYIEKLKFPVLIASHIKPYIKCNIEEQFDVNNGLLLSRTMDQLFDNGWISFNNDGTIIINPNLHNDLKNYLKDKNLDKKYLNINRLYYLKYHREKIYNPRKQYKF